MKLILLDIDGVIATDECSEKEWHDEFTYPFDAECVAVLNRIIEKTDAEIVLTSDWRIGFNYDLEMLDGLFKYNGVIKSPIDTTTDLSNRNREIEAYVQEHFDKISSFLIFDDANLTVHPDRFIRTNSMEGLKQSGIEEKAVNMLL
jgi:hypothetical protein